MPKHLIDRYDKNNKKEKELQFRAFRYNLFKQAQCNS